MFVKRFSGCWSTFMSHSKYESTVLNYFLYLNTLLLVVYRTMVTISSRLLNVTCWGLLVWLRLSRYNEHICPHACFNVRLQRVSNTLDELSCSTRWVLVKHRTCTRNVRSEVNTSQTVVSRSWNSLEANRIYLSLSFYFDFSSLTVSQSSSTYCKCRYSKYTVI